MVFSSSLFLFYFLPVFLLLYYLFPVQRRNVLIAVASLLFYTWGAPLFVFVLLAGMSIDFFLMKKFTQLTRIQQTQRMWAGVILNVALLLYFKYANFFVNNLNAMLHAAGFEAVQWTKVALPIGISFFTFHKLSYIIDVYRQTKAPFTKLSDYLLYILLFPQLIAGPIVRYNEIADQILDRRHQEHEQFYLSGFFRFIIGLSKKVLIANVLGEEADRIYALPATELTSSLAWVAAITYTFQIYFDFSGYSDMAIGLAMLMGFRFPENFNYPYIAQSITEFWRRWHITLGNWMRDYMYIPLGGNRVSTTRMYINLWLVFLISGFWHGAEWTFLIWGAYHGFFLVAERLFLNRITSYIGKPLRVLLTFFLALVGWVFFRAPDLSSAIHMLKLMGSMDNLSLFDQLSVKQSSILLTAALLSFAGAFPIIEKHTPRLYSASTNLSKLLLQSLLILFLCMWSFSEVLSSGFNPFIYFRF